MRSIFWASLMACLLTGCATRAPHAEFVRTVTFSSLQTFGYKHSFISGMDFRESEEMLLEALSRDVLVEAFREKGFEAVEEAPDFYLVVRWRKAVTSSADIFQPIDGPQASLLRRDMPGYPFASRVHLIVEVYEQSTDQMFWRRELPNLFDATQFTEERIVESLRRSVANFPDRVERDPDLPDIE